MVRLIIEGEQKETEQRADGEGVDATNETIHLFRTCNRLSEHGENGGGDGGDTVVDAVGEAGRAARRSAARGAGGSRGAYRDQISMRNCG